MNCIKFKECQNAIYPHKCKSCGGGMINFENKSLIPLKLEIKEIQYDISAKCNQIKLYTNNDKLILDVCDYCEFVDIELLQNIVDNINIKV